MRIRSECRCNRQLLYAGPAIRAAIGRRFGEKGQADLEWLVLGLGPIGRDRSGSRSCPGTLSLSPSLAPGVHGCGAVLRDLYSRSARFSAAAAVKRASLRENSVPLPPRRRSLRFGGSMAPTSHAAVSAWVARGSALERRRRRCCGRPVLGAGTSMYRLGSRRIAVFRLSGSPTSGLSAGRCLFVFPRYRSRLRGHTSTLMTCAMWLTPWPPLPERAPRN
jgi:hypothetical protein